MSSREYQRQRSEQLAIMGLCHQCGAAPREEGCIRCESCLAGQAAWRREYEQRRKKRRRGKVATLIRSK